jgi:hypothetical protein
MDIPKPIFNNSDREILEGINIERQEYKQQIIKVVEELKSLGKKLKWLEVLLPFAMAFGVVSGLLLLTEYITGGAIALVISVPLFFKTVSSKSKNSDKWNVLNNKKEELYKDEIDRNILQLVVARRLQPNLYPKEVTFESELEGLKRTFYNPSNDVMMYGDFSESHINELYIRYRDQHDENRMLKNYFNRGPGDKMIRTSPANDRYSPPDIPFNSGDEYGLPDMEKVTGGRQR